MSKEEIFNPRITDTLQKDAIFSEYVQWAKANGVIMDKVRIIYVKQNKLLDRIPSGFWK